MKQRLEWLDAMRGFTMILVVSYHVAQMSFKQDEQLSASLPFLVLFRMPLFFFVSGFLAYRSEFLWTLSSFCSLTWKKIKVQVFPALVFLCIFLILKSKLLFCDAFVKCMTLPTKGGYWFTWVLLQMFILYYFAAILSQRIKSNLPVWVLWFLSLCAYLSLYLPHTLGKWYDTHFMMYSSFYETLKFFHFFVFGNLVHRYWKNTTALFRKQWFYPVVTIVAFLSCADFFRWHLFNGEWINVSKTLAMYTLLLMVVMFFMHYESWFAKETPVGRTLQYIGVRTLDIYLLHFILLPKLPMVGAFLNQYRPNFLVDIVFAMTVALLVIAGCCLMSHVLRVSPIFKKYLFGR
ncbi:MAG: acyltransferase [Bacteroidaceae bacterium]|nr:acyltransferase [Bacteroidaceae bacterium]